MPAPAVLVIAVPEALDTMGRAGLRTPDLEAHGMTGPGDLRTTDQEAARIRAPVGHAMRASADHAIPVPGERAKDVLPSANDPSPEGFTVGVGLACARPGPSGTEGHCGR